MSRLILMREMRRINIAVMALDDEDGTSIERKILDAQALLLRDVYREMAKNELNRFHNIVTQELEMGVLTRDEILGHV